MRRAAILVAFLATGALSVPTGERWDAKCAKTCDTPWGDGAHVTFQSGRTHVYDYSSDVVTTLAGATDEESRLHVTATAEITANSGCDLTLQLRDISLQDSDPKDASNKQQVDNMETFKQALERWPLHFSYQTGRIAQLCANADEPVWVLNFKRGVLSTLVTMVSLEPTEESIIYEDDISGMCKAEYSISAHGSSMHITKQKDLLACMGRGHLISSLQSTPYRVSNEVQSLPLIKSSLECEQKVSEERLLSAVCRESHMFKPFSQGENGAVTHTTVRMTERTIRDAGKWFWQSNDAEMPTTMTTMLFDHTDAELTQQNRVPAAAELLHQLQEKTSDNVRPDVPHLFTRLVRMLRHFNEEGLAQLDVQLEDDSAAQRYFVDALPLAGSAPALSLMRDMILRGRVTDDTTDRWMTSLAFVHEPTAAMVAAVAPLLADRSARRQTLLGVSSLVHHYCQSNTACAEEASVQSVVAQLESALGSGCRAVSEDEEMHMLTALKALGNAGRLGDGIATLRSCFEDDDNAMEVRLAAISAFRRMPCSTVSDSGLMETFANSREDTEVRIAAYLGVMQCASRSVIDKVQEVLSTEEVNQVSSFVWSHLTNMQETSDPNRSYMKMLLFNVDLAKKFSTDMTKFSRFFEKTMFYESMNAGATVDANVIFTPDSYMPKSGMFNLTVDLFGEAFNLLEVGGRVEGLEDFSESLFGDNGIYPQEAISQIMKTMRSRQDTALSNRRIQSPKASAYMKIFGNELQFGKYDSLKELVASMGAKNPLDFLQKLAKDMDWTENYQFLDSAYTVPTIAGFPFTLKATGTATVSLKTGGSFDVQSWDSINIDGHIKPSAAVEIMSEMLVDAHVAHTGLKMNTNLHTSTILDGHAVVNGGKLVSVRINMPRDKVEVLDVNTRFHSVFRNKARKLEMYTDNRFEMKSCSDKYISTDLLGINFCADVSYSRGTPALPSCLFSGPLNARFTVEKVDTLKAFEFEYHHSNKAGIRKSSLVIDTVGSAIDRRLSVDYSIDYENSELKAGFHTPIKSMDVSGALDLAGQTKRADVSLTMDGLELFGVTSSLAIEDTEVVIRYSPSLSVRTSEGELGNFQGNLIANKDKNKYTADLAITKVFQTPIMLKGSFNEADGTYTVATSMKSFVLDGNMKGTFRVVGDNMLIQTNTQYTFMNGQLQTIGINSKMSQNEADDKKTYRLFVDTKFSALPWLDCQLTAERSVMSDACQTNIAITHADRNYRLYAAKQRDDESRQIAASVGFVAQHWNVDFKLGGSADFSENSKVMVTSEAQLNKEYFAKTKTDIVYKNDKDGFHYGAKTELALPSATYTLNTGIGQAENSGHLRMVAKQETNDQVKEVALVAALTFGGDELDGELTFSMPHYPRYELSTRVVPGTNGVFLARAKAQAGQRAYTLGAELKTAQHPMELDLMFERPGSSPMSARLTASRPLVSSRPEVTVDLRFGRRITAVLAGNFYPSENTGNFEIFWNKDVDETEKASVELLLREMDVSASLKYPGREIKLVGGLHADGWTADLQYAPEKVIHAMGNIPSEGRLFNINVNTPIEGFTTMSLTYTKKPNMDYDLNQLNFEVVGRLEEQESRLVGRVLLDQAIETKLEMFTPLSGWEKSLLSFRYLMDGRSFEARVLAAKNDDQFALGGRFEMFQQEVFKISTALDLELPTDLFRKGMVGYDLKFAEDSLDSGVVVQWKTTQEHELSLTLTSQHSVGPETHIDSIMTLHTPFEDFETMSSHLKFDNGRKHLNTLLNFKHADTTVFNVELLFSTSDYSHNGKFIVNCAKCPGLELMYQVSYENGISYIASASSHWEGKETSLSVKFDSPDFEAGVTKTETLIALVLPIEPSKYTIKHIREMDFKRMTIFEHLEGNAGTKKIAANINGKWNIKSDSKGVAESVSLTASGELTTPYQGWEIATISHTSKMTKLSSQPSYKGYTKYANNDGKIIELTDSVEFKDYFNWQIQREVVSNSKWVSSATHAMRSSGHLGSIQLTMDSETDGKTARFEYSHDLRKIHFSVSLSGKWFGGVTRSVKMAVRNADEAIYPSIDVTYDEDKTLRIYGSITKNLKKGQSSATLEAPFTERAVLSVSHDLDKIDFTVDYLHGEKRYTVDMDADFKNNLGSDAKFAIKFSSPRSCVGEGSIVLKYDLDDELKVKGKITLNTWEVSMRSRLGIKKGQFTVNTPYPGYTLLSVDYVYKGDEGEIRLKREENQILMVISRILTSDTRTYNMRINTPYSGYETITLSINSPLNQNRFNAEYQRGRQTSISATTEYDFSGPLFFVSVEAQSTLEGFSTSALHLSYNLFSQTAKFVLCTENNKIEANVVADLSTVYSKLSVEYFNNLVDFGLPQQLSVTGMYNMIDERSASALELAVIKGAEKFVINAEARASGAEQFITMNIETPIDGYESAKFDARLVFTSTNVLAKLELSKNEEVFKAIVEGKESDHKIRANIALHTPFEAYRLTRLTAEFFENLMANRESKYAKLVAERNTDKYEINATLEKPSNDVFLFSVTTPFTGIEKLSLEAGQVEDGAGTSTQLVLTLNQDQIRVVTNTEFSWTKSVISLEGSSPLPEARSFGVSVMYDIQNEKKTCSAMLTSNDNQYEMNASGVMKSGAATGIMELKSSASGWENIKYQATYDLNTDEKMMEISYERNGVKKVIASRGSYDGETAYIDVITPLEGYETMGLNGRYVSRRGKREAGYETHVNDHRHRLYVLYERKGLESAMLKIETPIEGMSMVQMDVRSQVFPDGVGYYINTNRDGKRSSIEIRTVKDDSSVGVDISVKSYIEGLESLQLSGSIDNSRRKKAFRFRSIRGSNEAEISGEVVVKKSSGKGKLKVQLPIQEWDDVDASFEYQLGQTKSFQLSSTRGGVTREYSGTLQYSDSSITVSLNTPFNGYKKLSVDASRSEGPDGKISSEIKLMRGNRKIEIAYDYSFSTTAGSAHAEVTTPYDGFRAMETSLEYDTGATSRSFEFRAKRDDREWHLQTSRTWETGADSGTLLIETPLADARKIKFSRAFNMKNLADMTYEAAYERNDRKFSLSGTGSIKRKGKKSSFDVTITTPLEIGNIGAKISYDFAGKPSTIKAKVNAGARFVSLDASLGLTEGSISLVTTNEMLPKVDVTYTADVSAKKRNVKATMALYDGRTLQLDYLADYTKKNKANGHIYLESTTYGTRQLTWDYAVPKDDFEGNLRYSSPNGNLDWSITVDGKQYVQRKVVIKSSIQSEIYTSTWVANLRYNTKNGFITRNKLVYNGKAYTLNFQAKKSNGKRVVTLSYDGQILKGIKIDGTWTLPGSPEQKKEFNINYERGPKTASLKGWFQVSPGGKSGSADIELKTPFEEVNSLHVETSWDFVLPNRILKIDYNRNAGKTYSLNFIESRQEANGKPYGKYNLVITTPPFEVKPGVTVYEYRWEFAFDLRYGHMYKIASTSPIDEEFKIDIKDNGNIRTVEAHYYFRDPNGLVEYMIPKIQIDFNSKRSERPTGPKIDLFLKTSFEGFEDIEVNIDVTKGSTTKTLKVDYRRGTKRAHMTAEVANSPTGGSVTFNGQTPFEGFEDVSLTGSYQKEPSYVLTLDYSRGDKFVRFTSSLQLDTQRSYGQLQSGSIDARLKLDSYITMPVDLLVTLDGSMETQPRRSGQYKLVVKLNDQTFSVNHQVGRVEAGRRTASITILTPFKYPFKKIVYNADVSLASNKAALSLEYGKKKVQLDASWFAGEGRQYGAEIRLNTPYKAFQAVELDAKATLQPRGDVVDVLVHYRRGEKMVHVTGTVQPFAVDLHFETPTFGNFGVKSGFTRVQGAYNFECMVTLSSGSIIGGHVAVKPHFKANDMQVTVDVYTPAPGWERLSFDMAYTNIKNSNIMRMAIESPLTKRVELSFELTNLTDDESTDFRAGVTTNYLGNAFTFRTVILRDAKGMKYELEIESPFHVLPSFKVTGRR